MPVVLGLMSGTSLDGLDLCCVGFSDDLHDFEILAANTLPYPSNWKDQLENVFFANAEDISKLDLDYGRFLGEQIVCFIEENNLHSIDLIASHGHTIFHKPDRGITLQIGDGKQIAELTRVPVVYDFRKQDVELGGQGAPLVPVGDAYLFSQYDACLNLGGFANISHKQNQQTRAFDIGACNLVLNRLAKSMGKEYDNNGDLARMGHMNESLYNNMNSLDYYRQKPPKSLGREFVESTVWPLIENIPTLDALHTYTQHLGKQIGKTLNQIDAKSCLTTGGGTFNTYLTELIISNTGCEIIIPKKELIEFKESLIFALLGWLRYTGKDNVFASVTGASKNHSSGRLAMP
jgi:anhydro-N-acetylmuramic acid kinase